MAHLSGTDRSQLLLLPEAIDDYVGPNNPVRFIEAFVDGLDLQIAGFARVKAKTMGRPGYDPADLLKLYIYGYLNRVRSSRRLEAETQRNIEVIWPLRHLRPDFKTIGDFRRGNRSAFRQVFRDFVLLGRTVLQELAGGRSSTIYLHCYGRRTYSGRPRSSMRFSALTAVATLVARRRLVRNRRPSPMTRLKRLMSASSSARQL